MPTDAPRTVVLVCGGERGRRGALAGCHVVAELSCPEATPTAAVLDELVQVAADLHADQVLVLGSRGRAPAVVPHPRSGA